MKFFLLLLSHENWMYPESHVLTGPANHVLMPTSLFSFHSVFFEAKFPAKIQHIQCAHTVHGKFGCRKFVSLFTFSITHLVCGDIEDHKGQLWRRNNEVCMAKWNYIKVRHKKTEQKILSRKYKVWKTRSWYIHKWRTEAEQWITSQRDFVPLAF